ncbi:tetraacyldisaccharide 4'-kinase [Dyadobacter pollutisoli]|uniref:Tetraacyldisaccharide 4'-kinase n=1 Tax=Dyadobacter pollutisoli TaxID=2910158 RepID=A0A9E8N756_9BACT|nr:tetraacyldisaccharide 4'-kinase [Dyadobacter pollutisoli]WAC09266.1 tetraacyldisaccharide 4'-kinase [Dyadobacter pollutisoli]
MEEHQWIKTALTPFSWVYGFITTLRNLFYDIGLFSSTKVPQFVISTGNLTVGGTGKTPVVEYLTNLLSSATPLAILSRGYGRETRGFIQADADATAATIGDEPLQYFTKFGKKVTVAVCENRVKGALEINRTHPESRLLLLDDAYQHRAIRRDINLLLNDYNRPFYNDLPFPAGRLRETRKGANRADAVIVTKCPPSIDGNQRAQIRGEILKYAKPETPVFFAFTDYAGPLNYEGRPVSLKNVKMVAGIANPAPFAAYLEGRFDVVDKMIFPDHHNYSESDLQGLIKYLKNDTFVVTTEKDMVKLKPLVEKSGYAERFAYIPVAVNFGDDTLPFSQWITKQIDDRL